MPVKRCGPLNFVKRKKENDISKYEENCFSSPTKKIKSLNDQKVLYLNFLVILYFISSFLCIITYIRINNNLNMIN